MEALREKLGLSEGEHVCDTCGGEGTHDERSGGYWFSNPKAECPDCNGKGWWAAASLATKE
jgi:DnaJ-class molecular chaperone